MRWKRRDFFPDDSWLLTFSVKASINDLDSQSVFQKATGLGLEVAGNIAIIEVLRADTHRDADYPEEGDPAFEALPGTYLWSIRASGLGANEGESRTVAEGAFVLNQTGTRLESPSIPIITTHPPNPFNVTNASVNAAIATDPAATQAVLGIPALIRSTAEGAPIDNDTDPLYVGRWCRVGDAFPFDWYQADTATTWVMRYSGLSPVIFNEDQSIFQKIVIVGTATNEYLQIQNL